MFLDIKLWWHNVQRTVFVRTKQGERSGFMLCVMPDTLQNKDAGFPASLLYHLHSDKYKDILL